MERARGPSEGVSTCSEFAALVGEGAEFFERFWDVSHCSRRALPRMEADLVKLCRLTICALIHTAEQFGGDYAACASRTSIRLSPILLPLQPTSAAAASSTTPGGERWHRAAVPSAAAAVSARLRQSVPDTASCTGRRRPRRRPRRPRLAARGPSVGQSILTRPSLPVSR